jgi:hypothetical protein
LLRMGGPTSTRWGHSEDPADGRVLSAGAGGSQSSPVTVWPPLRVTRGDCPVPWPWAEGMQALTRQASGARAGATGAVLLPSCADAMLMAVTPPRTTTVAAAAIAIG